MSPPSLRVQRNSNSTDDESCAVSVLLKCEIGPNKHNWVRMGDFRLGRAAVERRVC